jgi:hypothetical protein
VVRELLERDVQAGVALLDERGPQNWREMVDVDTLDIADPKCCVIGQVFPDAYFWNAMNRLGALDDTYGFTSHTNRECDLPVLTELWRAELAS